MSAQDSYRAFRNFEVLGQELDHGFIGFAFLRRGVHRHFINTRLEPLDTFFATVWLDLNFDFQDSSHITSDGQLRLSKLGGPLTRAPDFPIINLVVN